MKLALKKPVKLGDGELAELTFREELCAGDLRGIVVKQEMTFDEVMKIASRLTGQPEIVINRLSMADTGEVVRIVGNFLNGGPETGPTASQS